MALTDETAVGQVVFIDSAVPDLQDLLDGLAPGTQAFVLAPGGNGLEQIADILAANNLTGLAAISIVGHGGAGEMQLGSAAITASTLGDDSNALAEIGAALKPGGAIQLYGCDVAQGPAGQQFIDDFSTLAGGATVAAATHLVGDAADGGSFALDAAAAHGTAAAAPVAAADAPFTQAALGDYSGELVSTVPLTQIWIAIDGGGAATSLVHIDENAGGAAVNGVTLWTPPSVNNPGSLNQLSGVALDPTNNAYFLAQDTSGVAPHDFNVIYAGSLSQELTNPTGTPTLTAIYTSAEGQAATIGGITGIAADSASKQVYFTSNHSILKVGESGGAVTTLATGGASVFADGLALDVPHGHAYFFSETASFSSTSTSGKPTDVVGSNAIYVDSDITTPGQTPTQLAIVNGETINGTGNNVPVSLGLITAIAVDTTTEKLYFTAVPADDPATPTTLGHGGIYEIDLTGPSAGVITTIWSEPSTGILDFNYIAIDHATNTYFASDNRNGGAAVYIGSLSGGSAAQTPTLFTSIAQSTVSMAPDGLAIDNTPVLSVTNGVSGDIIQGAASATLLLNGADTSVTDSDNADQVSATISITNGKTGDELFVNGQQSGTVSGVTVSWDAATYTLTLTGAASNATYQTLLNEVGYKDTGTDTTTVGHPTRTIDWSVNDGLLSSAVQSFTVTIDRPPAAATHNQSVGEALSTGLTSLGDSDPDGDSVSVTALTGGTVGSSDSGTYGHLTINSSDTFTYVADNISAINAAPTGSHPVDSFTYTASDGMGGSTLETLNVSIDRPPVAVGETGSVLAGGTLSGTSGTAGTGALGGNSDPDGDGLTISALSGGTVGTVDHGVYGDLTLAADGSYTYVAGATVTEQTNLGTVHGTHAVDAFSFTVSDGHGGTTTGTLDITLDRPPVVGGTAVNDFEGGTVSSGAPGVLTGATDPDGDTVTLSGFKNALNVAGTFNVALAGTYGHLTLQSDGSYSYIADNTAVLNGAPTGSRPADTFTFTVSDGHGGTTSNTLSIAIDRPAAVTAGATATFTGGGAPVAADPALSVVDPDGDPTLSSATVSIGSGFLSGDTLAFTNELGITGSYDAATGVLTLSGTTSVANYQSALDSITYGFSPANGDPTGGGGDLSRTLNWTVNDGTVASPVAMSTIDTVHAAPVVVAGATASFTGGGAAVVLDGALTVSDADSGGNLSGATVTISSGFLTGDTLAFTNQNGITGSYDTGTGVLTLSGTASVADYQSALESIAYGFTPANGDPTGGGGDTARTITWTANDGTSGGAGIGTATSTLDTVHVPAVLTAGASVAYELGAPAVVLDAGLSVSDVDSGGDLTGATVQITGNFTAGDVLAFTNQNGITGSYVSGTGVLTLSGTASLADYQTALESIGFSATASGGGSRTIGWTVNDGAADTTATSAVTLGSGPAVVAGATASFTGGGAAVALDSGLTLSDPSNPDLSSATVAIASGFLSGDTLAFTNELGITGSYNSGTGVLTLSGTATVADYQSALDSITYGFTPANGDPTGGGGDTARTIDWIVSDGAASGSSTSTLDTVHVPAVLTAGASVVYGIGAPAVVLDAGLSVSDVDSGGNLTGAVVQIGAGFVSGDDTLAFTNQNGITGSYDAASGALTLSGTASLADYQTALESIGFSSTTASAGGRTIDWTVNDGAASSTATSTVTLVLGPQLVAGAAATFTGGGAPVALDPALTASDPASTTLASATVSIASGFLSGDTLAFTNQNGITGSYNAGTGVLTLSGTATVAQYQSALDSITYGFSPANGDPTGGGGDTARTIDWVASDGTNASTPVTSTLSVVHAPPLLTAGATVSYPGGAPVALDSALTVSDPDSGGNLAGATVAIGAGFLAGDTLNFTNTAHITGSYNAGTGILTLSGSASTAEYQAALAAITYSFTPAGGDPRDGGTDNARTIDWVVNDGVISASSTSTLDITTPPAALTAAVESLSATTIAAGGNLGLTLYDLNLGAVISPLSTTAIYLSTDPTITTADTLLTTQSVGALNPYPGTGYFDSHALSVTLPGGLASGTYYIGAIADYNDPNQSINAPHPTYDVMAITIVGPPAPALTAAVESLSATTIAAGGNLGLTLYDLNLGAIASGASTTALYLSTDPTITTADTLLATQSVGALNPYPGAGYFDQHALSVTLPGGLASGTYYIGAIADYNDPSAALNAPHPTYDVMAITIVGPPAPALTAAVESLSTTTVPPGGNFSLTLYDLNLGTVASGGSTTALYLSTDPTITTSDTLLATQSVGALNPYPGAGYFDQHSLTLTLPGGLAPGVYYIGAIADYNDPSAALNAPSPTYDVMQITVPGFAGAAAATIVSAAAAAPLATPLAAPLATPLATAADTPATSLFDQPASSPPSPPSPPPPNNTLPDTVVGFSDGLANTAQTGPDAGDTQVVASTQTLDGSTLLSFADQPPLAIPNAINHTLAAPA